jgi:hypothetical protein
VYFAVQLQQQVHPSPQCSHRQIEQRRFSNEITLVPKGYLNACRLRLESTVRIVSIKRGSRKAVVISNLCKGTAKTFLSVLREIRDDDSCGNSNLRLLHDGLDCTGRS